MKLFSVYNRISLVVTAILFIITAVLYYIVVNHIFIKELDEELNNYKEKITSYSKETGKKPEQGVMEDLEVNYQIVGQFSSAINYTLIQKYDSDEGIVEDYRQLTYTQRIGPQLYQITISKPVEGMHQVTRTIVTTTVIMLLLIVCVSMFVNRIVLKRLWQPFYESIKTIKKFQLKGTDAIPKLPVSQIDEFAFLNENLARSMESAKKEYQLLKEFTENASHEIQTPLAITKSKLDLLIQEESLSQYQVELISGAYKGIKRISNLNQSLLLLAKIENHQYDKTKTINLKIVLEEKMKQFKEFWGKLKIVTHLEDYTISANADLIDILLNNLLRNAGMHNQPNGLIITELTKGSLTISNTGSNHSLDKNQLFNRFYKQGPQSQQNGLGLSIVKQICDSSGIDIHYRFENSMHIFNLTWQNLHDYYSKSPF